MIAVIPGGAQLYSGTCGASGRGYFWNVSAFCVQRKDGKHPGPVVLEPLEGTGKEGG